MSVSIARLPDCPEVLDDVLVAQFHQDGYLAFENVLTAEEVEADRTALSEITGWLMDEARAGRAMIFSAMLPHQTPPNRSPHRRRALQFQYRGENTRQVSPEEFGKVFAETDGTPATCALAERLDG